MKTKFILAVAAALCVGLAACSDDAPEEVPKEYYALDRVLLDSSSSCVWVETEQPFAEGVDFNGVTYYTFSALLAAMRAAGFTADTASVRGEYEGRIDLENKTFGCAVLRKIVYNFKKWKAVSTANYYIDECACFNSTRSRYTRYSSLGIQEGDVNVIVMSHTDSILVTGYSKNYFEGEISEFPGRLYRFELINKNILINAGLTEIDIFAE